MTWSRERKRAREVAVADEFKLPHVEIKFLLLKDKMLSLSSFSKATDTNTSQ